MNRSDFLKRASSSGTGIYNDIIKHETYKKESKT
jgi:hypothetical protein